MSDPIANGMTASTDAMSSYPYARLIRAQAEVVSTGHGAGGLRVRLYHPAGTTDAWTWLRFPTDRALAPYPGQACIAQCSEFREDYILVTYGEDSDLSALNLLPHSLCPIPGVVAQTCELVEAIRHAGLRALIGAALTLPGAIEKYWLSPASLTDHHAFPGGLAYHSLEMATMVATSHGLPQADREIGITFALLHDFGKVWSYVNGGLHPEARRLGHVRIGYEKLRPALYELERQDPDMAGKLQELLGGGRQQRSTPYPLAIGRIVAAFDQMSCEKTRRSVTVDSPSGP